MFCSECGTDGGDGARFCPACGAALEAAAESTGAGREAVANIHPAAEPVSPTESAGAPVKGVRGTAEDCANQEPVLEELRALVTEMATTEKVMPGADGVLMHPLFAAADAAFAAGHQDAAEDILLDATEGTSEAGKALLIFAMLRANDLEFRGHGVEGLEIRRVELGASRVSIDALEMTLSATDAGAMIPQTTRRGEQVLVNLGTEIQLFGPNDDDERAAAIHARGFDSSGLFGQIGALYAMRVTRRLLWGFGHCLLTDQRACGLVFQRDSKPNADATPEREAMPDMFAASDDDGTPLGSVLVFSAARELFEDKELRVPLLTRRVPDINLTGDVDLCLSTWRVVDDHGRVVRPEKGQIAAAVEAFLPSAGG